MVGDEICGIFEIQEACVEDGRMFLQTNNGNYLIFPEVRQMLQIPPEATRLDEPYVGMFIQEVRQNGEGIFEKTIACLLQDNRVIVFYLGYAASQEGPFRTGPVADVQSEMELQEWWSKFESMTLVSVPPVN